MFFKTMVASAAVGVMGLSAQAATMTNGTFDVTAAESERTGGPVSLWFDQIIMGELEKIIGTDDPTFVLNQPGTFNASATAGSLNGSTEHVSVAGTGFAFDFTFDRDFSDNTITDPTFKPVFSDVNPNQDADYLDIEGGTLKGFGAFEGLVFDLARLPVDGSSAVQIGAGVNGEIGPNLHNSNFGMAFWFRLDSLVSADCAACALLDTDAMLGQQADINVDLSPAAVPLPAGAALLLTAMGGLGVAARKRKAS